MITLNKARCRKCKQEIVSTDPIELVECKCKALAISGGTTGYLYRRGLNFDELSQLETEEKPIYWPW
jgi:hypothetical protein